MNEEIIYAIGNMAAEGKSLSFSFREVIETNFLIQIQLICKVLQKIAERELK